jgi:hypothetical protein
VSGPSTSIPRLAAAALALAALAAPAAAASLPAPVPAIADTASLDALAGPASSRFT